MFSHVMVGSNDIARSKKFYDALFVAMGGQPGVEGLISSSCGVRLSRAARTYLSYGES
jgi:hypothetical protein